MMTAKSSLSIERLYSGKFIVIIHDQRCNFLA